MKNLTFLILCFASIALAEDFKTILGKEYKDVTVSRVEPDGITLTSSSGVSKVYFTELPKEVRERFNYDPQKAYEYSTKENKLQEQLGKQQQDAKSKQDNIRRLEALYTELDQKEEALMQKISKGEVGEYQAIPNELHGQLPFLYRQLDDVRHEKDKVKQQLEQGYRGADGVILHDSEHSEAVAQASKLKEEETRRQKLAATLTPPPQSPNPDHTVSIFAPRPDYPYEARSKHLTGKGVVVMTIDVPSGNVTDAFMAQSTGSPILDNSALSTFRRWRFKPGGSQSQVHVPINFTSTGASY